MLVDSQKVSRSARTGGGRITALPALFILLFITPPPKRVLHKRARFLSLLIGDRVVQGDIDPRRPEGSSNLLGTLAKAMILILNVN